MHSWFSCVFSSKPGRWLSCRELDKVLICFRIQCWTDKCYCPMIRSSFKHKITAKISSVFITVMQLKWNSQILKDFRHTFSAMSNIFKNPSEPIVSNEFGLLGMWIAWVIVLSLIKKYFLWAFGIVSNFMSFYFPILNTVFTFGTPFSL